MHGGFRITIMQLISLVHIAYSLQEDKVMIIVPIKNKVNVQGTRNTACLDNLLKGKKNVH